MALVVTGMTFASPALAVVTILFLMFALPASTMSLAINGSIGDALNPVTLATVMKRIGWPYLILYVFLLLVSAGSSATQLFLGTVAPVWLIVQLITFVSAYFTVIMFNMMGYVVYQYHEDLGFEDGTRVYRAGCRAERSAKRCRGERRERRRPTGGPVRDRVKCADQRRQAR